MSSGGIMARRPRDKLKLTDPLMEIDGARVAAAIAERKLKVREVARRVKKRDTRLKDVNEARIRRIKIGRTRKCRRSLLIALAAVLDQPIWFLSGGNLGWRQLGVSLDTTPRAYLAAHKLVGAVAKRAAREPRLSADAVDRLNRVLLDLLDPRTWRANLLGWPPRQRRDVRPAEMEVAVSALAGALTVILAPWLRADAVTLNVDALAGLLPLGARQPVLTSGASAVLPPLDGAAREDTSNPDDFTAAERDPDRFLPPLGAPSHEW